MRDACLERLRAVRVDKRERVDRHDGRDVLDAAQHAVDRRGAVVVGGDRDSRCERERRRVGDGRDEHVDARDRAAVRAVHRLARRRDEEEADDARKVRGGQHGERAVRVERHLVRRERRRREPADAGAVRAERREHDAVRAHRAEVRVHREDEQPQRLAGTQQSGRQESDRPPNNSGDRHAAQQEGIDRPPPRVER